jgi:hypothetical protein
MPDCTKDSKSPRLTVQKNARRYLERPQNRAFGYFTFPLPLLLASVLSSQEFEATIQPVVARDPVVQNRLPLR